MPSCQILPQVRQALGKALKLCTTRLPVIYHLITGITVLHPRLNYTYS